MRVVSDGTSGGTKVYDNSGDEVKLDIERVTIDVYGGGAVKGRLVIMAHPYDMDIHNSNITYFVGFNSELKPVKRIEFEDGTVWEKPS